MRNTLLALSSLTLSALLVTGAGCTPTTTTNANTANANTNTTVVPVDDTEDMYVDTDEEVDTDGDMVDTGVEGDNSVAISITSPADGDTVEPDFDVTVAIVGLELAPDEVEAENVEGHGHYHVWVDGEYFAAGVSNTTAVTDLTDGEHEIQVSLQNNDHSDLATSTKSDPIIVNVVAAE